jgi:hypothetical protein
MRESRRPRRRYPDKADIGTLIQQIAIAIPSASAEAQTPASRELVFHPTRKWRFDLGMPSRRVAVEVEGAIFKGIKTTMHTIATLAAVRGVVTPADVKAIKMMGGRHNKGAGMRGDLEKYNEAAALGWAVIRVMPEMITDGRALNWFEQVWNSRKVIAS